jgi:uncharacterized glyoxalase superfamily protein PhnB
MTSPTKSRTTKAALAILLLQRRSRKGVATAVGLALAFDLPDALKAAVIQNVASQALKKARALGRKTADKLIASEGFEASAARFGIDDMSAASAGERISRRWVKATHEARISGLSGDDVDDAGHDAAIDAAETVGENEALDAASDEVMRVSREAHEAGLTVTMTWAAEFTKGTCERCEDLDGEERTLPDEFEDEPPLHPRCACHLLSDIS